MSKISKEEYRKFQAHYTWEVINNPTYRYGQAFYNYFYPRINDLDPEGIIDNIYNIINFDRAKRLIEINFVED